MRVADIVDEEALYEVVPVLQVIRDLCGEEGPISDSCETGSGAGLDLLVRGPS